MRSGALYVMISAVISRVRSSMYSPSLRYVAQFWASCSDRLMSRKTGNPGSCREWQVKVEQARVEQVGAGRPSTGRAKQVSTARVEQEGAGHLYAAHKRACHAFASSCLGAGPCARAVVKAGLGMQQAIPAHAGGRRRARTLFFRGRCWNA